MARIFAPRSHENLPIFLRRMMKLRNVTAEKLAVELDRRAPKSDESWLRQVKLWRSDEGPGALMRANAELLGDALSADFTSFVRRYVENDSPSRTDEHLRQVVQEEVAASVDRVLAEAEARIAERVAAQVAATLRESGSTDP